MNRRQRTDKEVARAVAWAKKGEIFSASECLELKEGRSTKPDVEDTKGRIKGRLVDGDRSSLAVVQKFRCSSFSCQERVPLGRI